MTGTSGAATAATAPLDQNSIQLMKLSGLIQNAVVDYVAAQNEACISNGRLEGTLPSKSLYDVRRVLLAAAGMITELVSDPSSRIIEVALQHFEARALHLTTAMRIPDILAENGGSGCGVEMLAARVGVEPRKLCTCRVLVIGCCMLTNVS